MNIVGDAQRKTQATEGIQLPSYKIMKTLKNKWI